MIVRTLLVSAVLVALTVTPASAQESDKSPIEREIYEWVFYPCMSVRLSLALPSLDQDSEYVTGPRNFGVGLLAGLDTHEAATEAAKRLDGAPWDVRRLAYPSLLRQCLKEFTGLE